MVLPSLSSAAGPGVRSSTQAVVVVAVLLAAILHASWNALLKDGRDRLVMVVLLDLTAMVLSALLLPMATRPAPASWGLLGLSVLLHTGYKVLLMQSYQVGDLNQVYPHRWARRATVRDRSRLCRLAVPARRAADPALHGGRAPSQARHPAAGPPWASVSSPGRCRWAPTGW